jgi:hypothetical protein
MQVVRPKAAPSVFASLQLPKGSACTRLPGKSDNFVESILNSGPRLIEQRGTHGFAGQGSNPCQENPPEFVNQRQMQCEIRDNPSRNSSTQTDAVDQHQSLNTFGRTKRKADCECPAHGQTDKCHAFQTQSI